MYSPTKLAANSQMYTPSPKYSPSSPEPYEDQFLNMAKELEHVKSENGKLKKKIRDLENDTRNHEIPWYRSYYVPQNEEIFKLRQENDKLKLKVGIQKIEDLSRERREKMRLKNEISKYPKSTECLKVASFEFIGYCTVCQSNVGSVTQSNFTNYCSIKK